MLFKENTECITSLRESYLYPAKMNLHPWLNRFIFLVSLSKLQAFGNLILDFAKAIVMLFKFEEESLRHTFFTSSEHSAGLTNLGAFTGPGLETMTE